MLVNTLMDIAACEPEEGEGHSQYGANKGYLFHASCIWKVGILRVEVNGNGNAFI